MLPSGTVSKILELERWPPQVLKYCQLSLTNDCCQFITQGVHLCVQHHGHNTARCAGSSAIAETCVEYVHDVTTVGLNRACCSTSSSKAVKWHLTSSNYHTRNNPECGLCFNTRTAACDRIINNPRAAAVAAEQCTEAPNKLLPLDAAWLKFNHANIHCVSEKTPTFFIWLVFTNVDGFL